MARTCAPAGQLKAAQIDGRWRLNDYMRIAIDIDSTLHHYWDLLSALAAERFGVDLPYEDQSSWEITRLRSDQIDAIIEESHSPELIGRARPYPGAVEAINGWQQQGHTVYIVSARDPAAAAATEQWLAAIGLEHAGLYCVDDKATLCNQLAVGLLIDDSPPQLAAALADRRAAATISHPWNRAICARQDIVCAPDWPNLARKLATLLATGR